MDNNNNNKNKTYFIKTTYIATDKNNNFKGETRVYFKGRTNGPDDEKTFNKFRSYYIQSGHGYTTKAAVTKALKARNDLSINEIKLGYWNIKNEIIEFNL